MRWLALLALAGCWDTREPAAKVERPRVAPARAAACLPATVRDDQVVETAVVNDRVVACFGENKWDHDDDGRYVQKPQPCLAIDAGGNVSHAPWPGRPVKPDDGGWPRVVSDKREFEIEDRNNELWGVLIDIKRGTRLAEVKLTGLIADAHFGGTLTKVVSLHGDRAVIGSFPAGPGGDFAVIDPIAGKGLRLHGWAGQQLELDEHTLLVLEGVDDAPGHAVWIADLRTMTRSSNQGLPGSRFEDRTDTSARMLRPSHASVIIAYAKPAGFAVFDIASRRVVLARSLPICN